MKDISDVKRVVCHPRNRGFGQRKATEWGLAIQITDMCPPGSIYVFDPAALFDPIKPNLNAAARVDA